MAICPLEAVNIGKAEVCLRSHEVMLGAHVIRHGFRQSLVCEAP